MSQSIVGSWYAANPGGGTDQIVFTFLSDGTFLVADKGTPGRDPSGTNGLEWGTYSWDASSGALSFVFSINTDNSWGLSDAGFTGATVTGDILTFTGDAGAMNVNRLLSAPNSVVGSWYAANPGGGTDQIVFSFLADGTYLIADKGTVARDPTGTSGIEWGTYTWDPASGAFTFNTLVNTDGQWGLSHSNGDFTNLKVVGDSLIAGNGTTGMSLARLSPFASTIVGTPGNDQLAGGVLNDTILGLGGNDTATGGYGNDTIDGGAGIDTAAYVGQLASYNLAKTASGFTVSDRGTGGGEGVDTLVNVERLHFANTNVAIDLNGNAGNVVRILGAVFGPTFVTDKTFVSIGLSYADGGMSYEALMQLAIGYKLHGVGDHAAIVNLLWGNVIGGAPPASNLATYVGMLDNGMSAGALGVLAAQFNDTHIGFTGLAQTGVEYA